MIELPATVIQSDVIAQAAETRGTSVTDYLLDCALTYAANHLGMALGEVVALEQEYVSRGQYRGCGATHTTGEGGPGEFTMTCVRITGHRAEGIMARSSHVGYDSNGNLTSWEHQG